MKYNTIVIDPPWPESMAGKFGRRPKRPQTLPYKTMTLDEIRNFPLKDYAHKGAHVYLWTTNRFLKDAYAILEAWNVRFHLVLVGVKPSGVAPACGYVFGTEFCLLGIFDPPMQKFKQCGLLNWFTMWNGKGKHSAKPDEFYKRVEAMSPSPYIDIFSRKNREGWAVYGDETGKFT